MSASATGSPFISSSSSSSYLCCNVERVRGGAVSVSCISLAMIKCWPQYLLVRYAVEKKRKQNCFFFGQNLIIYKKFLKYNVKKIERLDLIGSRMEMKVLQKIDNDCNHFTGYN